MSSSRQQQSCHRSPDPSNASCFRYLRLQSIPTPLLSFDGSTSKGPPPSKSILTPQKLDYPGIGTSCHSPTRRLPPHETPLASLNSFLFVPPPQQPLHQLCTHPLCSSEIFKSLPRSYPLPPLPPKSLSLLRLSQQSRVISLSNFYKSISSYGTKEGLHLLSRPSAISLAG